MPINFVGRNGLAIILLFTPKPGCTDGNGTGDYFVIRAPEGYRLPSIPELCKYMKEKYPHSQVSVEMLPRTRKRLWVYEARNAEGSYCGGWNNFYFGTEKNPPLYWEICLGSEPADIEKYEEITNFQWWADDEPSSNTEPEPEPEEDEKEDMFEGPDDSHLPISFDWMIMES